MATRICNGWRWTVALGIVAGVRAVVLDVLQAQQRGGKPQALSSQDFLEIQQLGAR